MVHLEAFHAPESWSPAFALLGVLKALFLSIGFFLLYQTVKIYRAYLHLKTLNEHRHNAMKVFDVFTQATNDPQVRDAVLIQISRYIFSDRATGFLGSKEELPQIAETLLRELTRRE